MTKTAPKPPNLFDYARRCLFSPAQAAAAAAAPGSLRPAVWLYLAFLLGMALLLNWKPYDFPDAKAALPPETRNLGFWLQAMLWQPPLEAAFVLFVLSLLEWMRVGKLFWRLVGGVLATAVPALVLVYYKNDALGRPAGAAILAAWAALMVYGASRGPKEFRMPVFSLMLALNVIGVVMLLPMFLGVAFDSPKLFMGAQIVQGLWLLLAAALGLRALSGSRLPRCFMTVLLALFMQIGMVFSLRMLGLVSSNILKALLYA